MLVLPWIFQTGFAITMLNQTGVLIVFALAYNMLLGQGGMLSFGHAVYFGIAGYFTAHYLNGMGEDWLPYIPVTLLPILGGLTGLLFGILIGFVSTRRAGTIFAMISLGFAEMATALTLILVVFFNGEEGVQTDRMVGPEPLGITFAPDVQVYYLIAIWCLAATMAMYALTRTPSAACRTPFATTRNGSSSSATARTGFAGWRSPCRPSLPEWRVPLHALNIEHVGFETIGLEQSGLALFMVWIGGARTFVGPILGAILITYLNSNLSDITDAWYLYLGILFMTIVMFAQGGLSGLIVMHEPIWKTDYRLFGRMIAPYARGIGATFVATIGAIGLIEIIYFLSTRVTEETNTMLFWMEVDAASTLPWIAYAAVTALGVAACRRTYPPMANSYNEAIAAVKERVAL